jgi:protein gp37
MARLHYHKEFPKGWDGHVHLFPARLAQPLHWRKPRKIAVGLMGDLFHESVPDDFIEDVFATMANTQNIYQILTKRHKRMLDWMRGEFRDIMIEGRAQKQWYELTGKDPSYWLSVHLPLPNVWIGVTAENQQMADERREPLAELAAMGWITWVSSEPRLGPIDWSKWEFIKLLVTGGESGPGARPMHQDWPRNDLSWCQKNGIKFHFKQWGEWLPGTQYGEIHRLADPDEAQSKYECMDWDGDEYTDSGGGWADDLGDDAVFRVGKKAAGHLLDGKEWLQFPEVSE